MPTFFVEAGPEGVGNLINIDGDDAWHISRSLRLAPGARVTLVQEVGREREAVLEEVGPTRVVARVVAESTCQREPRARLHVLQAIPKGQGMTEVCERLAELGVMSVWPILTERTIPRLDPEQGRAKRVRWQRVAREAAQLARRHQAPRISDPLPLLHAVRAVRQQEESAQLLACDQRSAAVSLVSAPWDPSQATALVIGPEGGLAPAELDELRAEGAIAVSLGPRNLRTLLASTVAATVLLQRAGDLEPPRL